MVEMLSDTAGSHMGVSNKLHTHWQGANCVVPKAARMPGCTEILSSEFSETTSTVLLHRPTRIVPYLYQTQTAALMCSAQRTVLRGVRSPAESILTSRACTCKAHPYPHHPLTMSTLPGAQDILAHISEYAHWRALCQRGVDACSTYALYPLAHFLGFRCWAHGASDSTHPGLCMLRSVLATCTSLCASVWRLTL
jgi:hypothetical protein